MVRETRSRMTPPFGAVTVTSRYSTAGSLIEDSIRIDERSAEC